MYKKSENEKDETRMKKVKNISYKKIYFMNFHKEILTNIHKNLINFIRCLNCTMHTTYIFFYQFQLLPTTAQQSILEHTNENEQ